jgi:anaerobic magnesium-protoporphyrin IX monomethyl ester cyclase
VDLLLQEDTIEALAESGAETVWVGAESGSQKILDAMDKGTRVEEIKKATELLKKNNIRVAFFLQFGYPGETKEDINKTIDMVLKLIPDEIGISVSYPLPGTKFYEKVKDQLKEKSNWTDSDELALMFRNTFPPDYYKKLHRYVHKVYRKRAGLNSIKNILLNPFSMNAKNLRSAILTFYYIPAAIIDSFQLKKLETAE